MKFNTIVAIVIQVLKAQVLRLLGKKHLIRPYKILLQTTNDCNSFCETCHIWKINKEDPNKRASEVNLGDTQKVFQDLGDSLLWLALSGGEVTLHNETSEMIRQAKMLCPNLKFVTFTTNGIIPQRVLELASVIKELELDSFITISLDGDEETHDKLRGVPGNYKKALETKRLLDEHGITAHFGITLSEKNHDFVINKFSNFKDTMRAVTFEHGGGIYNKQAEGADAQIISSLKHIYKNYPIFSLSDIVEKLHIRLAIKFLEKGRKENIISCDSGYSSLHIFPNGDVSPCMFLQSSGNIKKDSINKVIQGEVFQESRSRASVGDCSKCWMNCYSPHSIMKSPLQSIGQALRTKVS